MAESFRSTPFAGDRLAQHTPPRHEAPVPNHTIKDYVESDGPTEWKWQPLAKDLYEMANVFRMYFFAQKTPEQDVMPQPLVAIEDLDVRTPGAYYLHENPLGLRWQISLNAQWAQTERRCHAGQSRPCFGRAFLVRRALFATGWRKMTAEVPTLLLELDLPASWRPNRCAHAGFRAVWAPGSADSGKSRHFPAGTLPPVTASLSLPHVGG